MKNLVICFLVTSIISLLMIGCDSDETNQPIDAGQRYLAVAGMTTLTLADLESGEWNHSIFGLGNAPNWLLPDNDRLFCINSRSNDLTWFIADTMIQLEKVTDLGLGYNRNPYSSVIAANRMFVTNLLSSTVSVIDLQDGSVLAQWQSGLSPEGIAIVEDRIYIVNTGYSFSDYTYHYGSLWVLDSATGELVDSLQLGINPQFIVFDQSSGYLHIAQTGDYSTQTGSILLVHPETLTLSDQYPVDFYPGRLAAGSNGSIYVAAGGWASESDEFGIVLAYTATSGKVTDVRVLETGMGALDVCYDPVNSALFVACMEAMRIDEFRSDTLYTFHPLQEPPQALALWSIE